jgi:hypothetical protein
MNRYSADEDTRSIAMLLTPCHRRKTLSQRPRSKARCVVEQMGKARRPLSCRAGYCDREWPLALPAFDGGSPPVWLPVASDR